MIILYLGLILIVISFIRREKTSLVVGFALVFSIMGFQEGVDGDYMAYKYAFEHNEVSLTNEQEPLWNLITSLIYPIGWYAFVALISLFQTWVLYRITKKHASNKFRWLAPIIFFFWFGMMLIQMKALRQGLAIELCLLPMVFDLSNKKRKWLWCFAPCVAAYFIHNSSIIMLPIIILYYLQVTKGFFNNISKTGRGEYFYPSVITFFFVITYSLKGTIIYNYLHSMSLMLSDFRLGTYLEMNETNGEIFVMSDLIVFADAIFVFLLTWSYRYLSGVQRILVIMAVIANFFDMFFFGLGSLARIGYFYLPALIVAIPNATELISKRFGNLIGYLFIIICIAYGVKTSLPWLTDSLDGRFANYRFIFLKL